MPPSMNGGISRRQFLEATAAAMAATTLAGPGLAAQDANPSTRRPSLIRNENAKPGTTDWQLTRVRLDRTQGGQNGVRSRWIEGYCSHQSVRAGESIDIMVSTNPPSPFTIEVFRTGYYGGKGARAMTVLGPFAGVTQPDPAPDSRRVIECRWKPSTKLTIPPDWPSGVYLGRLTTVPSKADEPYWQSYVVFIVRDERPVDVLFQCSDNTWQAYNRWPDRFSLYDDGSANDWSTSLGLTAGFDRPYGKFRQIYENPQTVGSGEYLCWEFPLAYWLEQHGYDVAYCSNSDMLTPDRGLKSRCFVSIGHDEYWDVRQYHSVKAMIDAGVSALFLTGNAISGVTPFSPSSDGRPNRIITRTASYGGWDPGETPAKGARKKRPDFGPDEGLLMGARNVSPVNGGGDWIVTKPDHWIFEGTGMKRGDRIPGLVGWEYHGDPAKIPGLEVVAEGTAWRGGDVSQHWTATVYPGPRKNFVFNAATIFWAQGLSSPPGHMLPWSHWNRPHGPDERVQRIARNLLARALRPSD